MKPDFKAGRGWYCDWESPH